MKVPAINRRISAVILVFVALSLSASLLPLLPGVREVLPLEFLDRRDALGVYAASLLGFMAMLFPAFVQIDQERRSVMPWAWVGGFALAFAGVPTFVLAYIAGVHVRGVIEILLWAGAFHGFALLMLRLVGPRGRALPVVIGFLFAIALPFLGHARRLLEVGTPLFSPFTSVSDLAAGLREPDPALPGALTVALYAAIVVLSRRSRPVKAVATAVLVGVGAITLAAASPAVGDVTVTSMTGSVHVPGRPVALRLEASAPGVAIEVAVGGRERYRWTPKAGGPLTLWVYPHVDSEIRVTADGGKPRVMRFEPTSQPVALLLGDVSSATASDGIRFVRQTTFELPDRAIGLAAFSALMMRADDHDRLQPGAKDVLTSWVRDGGALELLASPDESRRLLGAGSITRRRGGAAVADAVFPSVAGPEFEGNLYSNFAVPDWGRVDLTPLIIFLGVYHLVFYLIFLLPLLLDARKGLGVYLTSVGFVLALVIVGAYFALTRVFLEENQLLQQSVQAALIHSPTEGEAALRVEQLACYASFNDQPVELAFDAEDCPWPIHAESSRGLGDVMMSPDGKRLTMPAVVVDRHARKQVVSLSRTAPSPIRVERGGPRSATLRPVPGVPDAFGLWTAKRVAAFVRDDGWLHGARFDGATLTWDAERARTGWSGVLSGADLEPDVLPFLRYLLGRRVSRDSTVAVVLVEGMRPVDVADGALHVRDILQVILIPLPPRS